VLNEVKNLKGLFFGDLAVCSLKTGFPTKSIGENKKRSFVFFS
jgi:hypothetical protein